MSDESPRVDREGIYIERDLADEVAIDEELDANATGAYRFPSTERRRLAAWVYLIAAAATVFAFPQGWAVAIGLAVISGWHFLSAWPMRVDEHDAMTTAAGVVDFAVGHASASVRFKGWRSRPRWSVVMYSAAEPPDRRALVVVDAITGDVAETPYVEEIGGV